MERSYLSTMTLLLLHQIDAAYWREWEMFHLPGGVQGYLVFNLFAISILLLGFQHVVRSSNKATAFSLVCASLGMLTFLIHARFLLAGFEQFQLPLSITIIVLCAASSVWQFVAVRSIGRKTELSPGRSKP